MKRTDNTPLCESDFTNGYYQSVFNAITYLNTHYGSGQIVEFTFFEKLVGVPDKGFVVCRKPDSTCKRHFSVRNGYVFFIRRKRALRPTY